MEKFNLFTNWERFGNWYVNTDNGSLFERDNEFLIKSENINYDNIDFLNEIVKHNNELDKEHFEESILRAMEIKEKCNNDCANFNLHIHKTFNYDMFHIMEKGNREIDHINRLKKSMSEFYVISPICVNEKYEIIDGQNRFTAAKELNLPIYYFLIKGYGIKEVRALNMNARNWTKKDFVKSYADEGVEAYKQIEKFKSDFPDLPISMIELILTRKSNTDSISESRANRKYGDSLINGNFKIKDLDCSYKIASDIMKFKNIEIIKLDSPIYKRRAFVVAIIQLERDKNFDANEVIRKISINPRMFVPCLTSKEYISMFEDIVNFHNKNKIRFNTSL